MREALDLVVPVMRVGDVRPGSDPLAVSIDVIVPVRGTDHVVTFSRDANGCQHGSWAHDKPAQFVDSGFYRLVSSVLNALGQANGHSMAFYRDVLLSLHGYVSALADAVLDEYDAALAAA